MPRPERSPRSRSRRCGPRTQEEQVQAPRKKIRVLEDPYQISSFYRSHQGQATVFGYDDPVAPLGRVSENPYAIAGYYRNRQVSGYGYSQFWSSGYGNARGRRFGYGRRIGVHGDLFLIRPRSSPRWVRLPAASGWAGKRLGCL